MWRTFWKDVRSIQEFDEFLNSIENAGYAPAYIREQTLPAIYEGRHFWVTRVVITARNKDA